MTVQQQHLPAALSTGTDYEQLAERFRPIFTLIAEGALQREQNRSLPFEPITWLKQAGFGAVRVPTEFSGAGASVPQLIQLLIELATFTVPARADGEAGRAKSTAQLVAGPGKDGAVDGGEIHRVASVT